jgi:hypothetical protein
MFTNGQSTKFVDYWNFFNAPTPPFQTLFVAVVRGLQRRRASSFSWLVPLPHCGTGAAEVFSLPFV